MEFSDKMFSFVLHHFDAAKLDTRKAISHFNEKAGSTGSGQRRFPFTAAAVIAIAACAALVLIIPGRTVTVRGSNQKNYAFNLPDGTEVTLSPLSSLSYDKKAFRRGDRSVNLEGLAFFDVTRDSAHPFEVRSDSSFVRVLGTKFQVRTGSGCAGVSVIEGKVLYASDEGREVLLTAGMDAVWQNGGPVLCHAGPNPCAWATGRFRYEDTPLDEVLDELGAFFGCTLTADTTDKRLTAEFGTEDPDTIIELIESALGVKVTRI